MISYILYGIYGSALLLIILLLILIFMQKHHHNTQLKRTKKARDYFYQVITDKHPVKFPNLKPLVLFEELFNIEDQMQFRDEERETLLDTLPKKKMFRYAKRRARSIFPYKRILGSQQLGLLRLEDAKKFLIRRFKKEKNASVKFYIVYALLNVIDYKVLNLIIDSLEWSSEQYVNRVCHLLRNHYGKIHPIFEMKSNPKEHELYLYATLAKNEYSFAIEGMLDKHLPKYLSLEESNLTPMKTAIRSSLLEAAFIRKHSLLSSEFILEHHDFHVRKYGYQYLAQKETIKDILILLDKISDDEIENKYITNTIQQAVSSNNLFDEIINISYASLSQHKKQTIASIFSSKIDYLIITLNKKDNEQSINAIQFILEQHQTAGLIAFLNRNKNKELEDLLFSIIHPLIKNDAQLKKEFTSYLNASVLKNQKLQKTELSQPKREKAPIEKSKIIWMIIILMIVLIAYPLLSLAEQRLSIFNQPFIETFKAFILDTNRNLIFYFMAANMIYLILLAISLRGAKKQRNLWTIKSERLLYEEDILPAISIIAPAYNEELSIITSVQSLLNLKYPSYEVVVVNDGSKDQTLQKLIDYFDLKREDANNTYQLQTKEIRGIYTNKSIPNLKVVNKVNGGKADALNVGINIAKHPYICGIDADSVLEQEALLRLMSITLDHKNTPVALGGNIVPANGCKIDHGYIEEKKLPKELIPRFQSLEYLRAFTSGRIGWSSLHSLLIISGAFGLFKKDDITEIGGYITSSGVLKKDSVGEDMELVVRLTHDKLKQKEPYLISYVYHANCYTELPSDAKTLLKQRNRWHRGLIDILSYHRSMLLNPRYKQIGLFALPYFYIFEVMGPFFELIGYLALIISFAFGFLAPMIVLGIFGASIVMGMVLSLASLYIAETVNTYTSKKDVFIVLLFAFIENIGYRQIISMHRVYSFFTALFESGAWGEQKRKGI
ncbi:MAG: glycosyltransferase family 2 protein [Candidatus Izemoplasmataceae bacterium]